MGNEIAKPERDMGLMSVTKGQLAPNDWAEYIAFAKMVASSGMVPKGYVDNPGACLVAFQMGAEVGLKPLASIQNIAVINGRPSLWGDGLLAVVVAHPDCEGVDEIDPGEITDKGQCTVKRRGRSPVTRTFSIDDAKTAGLWGKGGPWSQYPKRMLQMRARGFACRDAFPDALRGLHLAEETIDIPMTADWVEEAPTVGPPAGRHKVKAKQPEAPAEPDPDTGEVIEVVEATPESVLAGIASAATQKELLEAATQADQLSDDDKERARIAFRAKRDALRSGAELTGKEAAKAHAEGKKVDPPTDSSGQRHPLTQPSEDEGSEHGYGPPPMGDEEAADANEAAIAQSQSQGSMNGAGF